MVVAFDCLLAVWLNGYTILFFIHSFLFHEDAFSYMLVSFLLRHTCSVLFYNWLLKMAWIVISLTFNTFRIQTVRSRKISEVLHTTVSQLVSQSVIFCVLYVCYTNKSNNFLVLENILHRPYTYVHTYSSSTNTVPVDIYLFRIEIVKRN